MKPEILRQVRLAAVCAMFAVAGGGVWMYLARRPVCSDISRIVLISIDTCRADTLSCYGFPMRTTPNIDAIAAQGVLFENVIAPVPLTLPSHSSMLTGTIPPFHGVHDNLNYRLSEANLTLAEILSDNGFAAGAVVGAFVLDSRFGLDQGFHDYQDSFDEKIGTEGSAQRRGGEVSRYALQWLDQHADQSFFLFAHYYDPHAPYEAPEPIASTFAENIYAAEIAYVDQCVGEVVAKLKDLGIYDSTLIVITGDHGEMLGEHGEAGHTYFIYQGALRVPLIFKLPGRSEPRRVKHLVGLVDIVPTILRLAGLESPDLLHGVDLTPTFRGHRTRNDERVVYCESLTATKYDANSLLGLVTERWKYIETSRPELYDLLEDPRESNNLATREPARARALAERLRQILDTQAGGRDSRHSIDEETRRRLESLGYIGGSQVKEDFAFDRSKDDPKDLLAFHLGCIQAMHLIDAGDYDEAQKVCETLATQRADAVTPHFDLARIAIAREDYSNAVPRLRRVLELDPAHPHAHNFLGNALRREGKLDEAIGHLRTALELNPDLAEAHRNLGVALHASARSAADAAGRIAEAFEHLTRAVEIDPNDVEALFNLGHALFLSGQVEEAAQTFRQALQIDSEAGDTIDEPGNAPERGSIAAEIHYNLAVALHSQGKLDEAVAEYRAVVRISPQYADSHINLGAILASVGKHDEALRHLGRAVELKPSSVEARWNLALLLQRQGQTNEAVQHLQQVIRLRPDHAQARKRLNKIKGRD